MNKFLFLIISFALFQNCFGELTRRQRRTLHSYISRSNVTGFKQVLNTVININKNDKQKMTDLADKIVENLYRDVTQKKEQNIAVFSNENNTTVGAFAGITAVGVAGSLGAITILAMTPEVGPMAGIYSFIPLLIPSAYVATGTIVATAFLPVVIIGAVGLGISSYFNHKTDEFKLVQNLQLRYADALAIQEILNNLNV